MKRVLILLFGFIFFNINGVGIVADTGHSDEKSILGLEDTIIDTEEETNPYAKRDEESGKATLSLARDGFITDGSAELEMKGMNPDLEGKENSHSIHQMLEINLSQHEWVPTSRKGYWAAVTITLLAGVVFGAMNFIRSN